MPSLADLQPYQGPDTPLLLLGRDPGPDGAYGRPSPDAPLPRDPTDPTLWLPGQGRANACGTTTMAYVLRYLLGSSAPSCPQIDWSIRRADIFTAPTLLVSYARNQGLLAEGYDGFDLDTALLLVDDGAPVMVLLDTTPLDLEDTANLHWVCIVAHDGDSICVYNPHGFQQALDRASFEEHWHEARLFGMPAWSRYAIAVAPPGLALPLVGWGNMTAAGASLAAKGVAGIVNGSVSLRRQATENGPSLRSLAAIPGLLGLVVPAAQTLAGAAVVLGAAAAERLRGR
jgi:hypothetical protein